VIRVVRTISLATIVIACAATSGCFWRKQERVSAFTVRTPSAQTNLVLTPLNASVGRVASVNDQARIAVATFPIGQVPPAGARFAVIQSGRKVGELKMSQETADTLRVGDIVDGTAQPGDELRPLP
jgi:hypothetical protein